jgi:hypothetical protein
MPVYVQYPSSPALLRRCREIADAAKPGSKAQNRLRGDLQTVVKDDHTDMMLRNVDRYGKTRADLAESTLNRRKGTGPSLIPRGALSRFVANCEVLWQAEGGVKVLVKRFRDVVDRKGRPFAQYHLTGASKPGTRWVLPRRDVGGVTPKGWARVQARWKQFAADLAKTGGGKGA